MKDNYGIVKPTLCPSCGYFVDCATAPTDEDLTPTPGDFSVCMGCAALNRFADDLSLRSMGESEIGDLSEENRRLVKRSQEAVMKLRKIKPVQTGRQN